MKAASAKAVRNYTKYSDPKLSAFTAGVINCMKDNGRFPNSADLITVLTAAKSAYDVAFVASLEGGRTPVAEKNMRKTELLVALSDVCDMVNYVAQGDRVALSTTGFELSKEVILPVPLIPAKNVVVTYGDSSGQMDVDVQGSKNHKGMMFQYAVVDSANNVGDSANWVSVPSGTAKCTLTNMPVGQKVVIRVGISGARKQVIYTDPITKVVA